MSTAVILFYELENGPEIYKISTIFHENFRKKFIDEILSEKLYFIIGLGWMIITLKIKEDGYSEF